MKVLFINLVYGIGSTGKIISDIMNLLEQSGDEVRALYGVWGKPKDSRSKQCSTYLEYCFHNRMSRLTDHAGLYSWQATRRMIREIQSFQPDVIHLHTLHGFYLNFEMLFRFLKESKIPVIWTLHDCWAFTGHCTHYSQVQCDQWRTQCTKCDLLHRYPQCYFGGDVQKNFNRKKRAFLGVENMTITVPSQWLAAQVAKSFLRDYPIRVIPNGVDLSIFHQTASNLREENNLREKKIVLGVANAWNKRKGLDDILCLASRLDAEFRVVLIGLTEEQLTVLPHGVLGIKRTSNQNELAQWYSAADVFINPTYEETFGMTTIEAQACGTPVVVYRTDGCPETVASSNGILVEQGNLDKLEAAVRKIVNSGISADAKAMQKFEISCAYKKYVSLYAQLLKSTSESGRRI